MFTTAIVRTPGESLVHGLTTASLGPPDYERALNQHRDYIRALRSCGLDVMILDADEAFPDSIFVEDTALLTPYCAILMYPGAESRRGEVDTIEPVIRRFYSDVERVTSPGMAEAGDIMNVDTHYYIGLSERTNAEGAGQVIDILNRYRMSGSTLDVNEGLHLKTGMAYLQHNNLVISDGFMAEETLDPFHTLVIPRQESYAANCIWVNDAVILPSGYPVARERITNAGYSVLETDLSEFQKLDGGASCLSLRF
jgi:dimethylargininase